MTPRGSAPSSRRRYLERTAAVVGAVCVAGCSDAFGGEPERTEEPTTSDESTESGTETADETEDDETEDDETEDGDTEDEEPTNETTEEADEETAEETDDEPEDEGTEADADEPDALADYETTEVRATTADGEVLGSVTAAIADTADLRYLGLSDVESLPEDRGMLFVHEETADRTFVMREMDFGIDIVYADGDGVVTRIHHAPEPGSDEDGERQRYPGRGRYVLEVGYGWTTDRDVAEGDVLEFEL